MLDGILRELLAHADHLLNQMEQVRIVWREAEHDASFQVLESWQKQKIPLTSKIHHVSILNFQTPIIIINRATFSQASFIAASRIAPAQPQGMLGHPRGGMTSIRQIFRKPPDLHKSGAMETKNLSRYWCRNNLVLSVFHWSTCGVCQLVQSGRGCRRDLSYWGFFSDRSRFPSDYGALVVKHKKLRAFWKHAIVVCCCSFLWLRMRYGQNVFRGCAVPTSTAQLEFFFVLSNR